VVADVDVGVGVDVDDAVDDAAVRCSLRCYCSSILLLLLRWALCVSSLAEKVSSVSCKGCRLP
jgi:hypothetical protein